jgi:hypothetical protein
MGYATVRGHYHKGPKKTKHRNRNAQPKPNTIGVLVVGGGSKPTPHDDRTMEVLTELLSIGSRPTQTARPMPSNGDCGIVVVQSEGRGSRSGMAYTASLGGFGGGVVGDAPMQTPKPSAPKPTAPKPSAPTSVELAEGETLVGFIIRKPNGEMVLKFSK